MLIYGKMFMNICQNIYEEQNKKTNTLNDKKSGGTKEISDNVFYHSE